MNTCPRFDHFLVLPHLRVQNANAVSSPLTHGFPSMTAFLGLMWALERKTHAIGMDLAFRAIGVVCHDHQEQVTEGGFVKAFRLTRNPVGKDGGTAAIVEEGRIHLELSLVLAVHSNRWNHSPELRDMDIATVAELLARMRIAGGSLLPTRPGRYRDRPWVLDLTGTEEDRMAEFRKARMRLLPGFVLVSRDDRLETRVAELRTENPEATRLDAWLSLSRINWCHQPGEKEGDKGEWLNDRRGQGWTVPIPVGYGALGDLHEAGSVANARDASTPFRFVESLFSIGEWVSPHRLQSPQQLLWYADSKPEDGRYRCRNDYQPTADVIEPLYDLD